MNERIKELRNHLGLTQIQFAEKLNLSQNFIAQIESGKRNMSDRTIIDICDKLNVDEEWLRTGSGDMFVPPEDERATYVSYLLENVDDPIAEAIADFMKVYLECDPKDRLVLQKFAKKLKKGGD